MDSDENDSKAMGNMVQRAKSILRTNEFTVLYDKGFHTGSEFKTAQDLGVETIVGFMFIAYNLRRIISILGENRLREYLRILVLMFLTVSALFRRKIRSLGSSIFQDIFLPVQIHLSLRLCLISRENSLGNGF